MSEHFTVADHVRRDTAAQELPLRVDDEATLKHIAALVRSSETASGKREGRAHHDAASARSEVIRDGQHATTT